MEMRCYCTSSASSSASLVPSSRWPPAARAAAAGRKKATPSHFQNRNHRGAPTACSASPLTWKPCSLCCSCGPPLPPAPVGDMVSRRRILSRSRDDLNLDSTFNAQQEEEEDVWYNKDKLYKVSARSHPHSVRNQTKMRRKSETLLFFFSNRQTNQRVSRYGGRCLPGRAWPDPRGDSFARQSWTLSRTHVTHGT